MSVATRFDFGAVARLALDNAPPRAGKTFVSTITNASAAVAIPDAAQNAFVEFCADADMYINFGASTAVADGAATSGNNRSVLLEAKKPRRWFIAQVDGLTHFAAILVTGTSGYLRWHIASHKL